MNASNKILKFVSLILIISVWMIMPSNVSSKSSDPERNKVLIIGLDGADWKVMDPLLEGGELPNLKSLIKEGRRSDLESSIPSMSPVAWTTFATGKNPGKHGVFSFLRKEGDEFIPLTSEDVKSKSLWDITSRENLSSIVINVPMTYPPHEVKGKMISGYLSIDNTTYTYPESLQKEIENRGYKIEALSDGFEPGKENEFLKDLNYTVEKRTETAKSLLKENNWNLSVVVYTGLDRLQHYFWKYMDEKDSKYENVIPDHYEKLDKEVGELLEIIDNDTKIIVLSDHGFGELRGEVYLNHWLKKEGYLEMKKSESFLGRLGISQQGLVSFLKDLGIFEPVKWIFEQIGIYDAGKNLPRPRMEDIDMKNTKAFAANFGGGIYITAENYKEVKEEIKQKIRDLKNPETGEMLFTEIKDKSEVYNGEMFGKAPDLIVDSPKWDPVGFLGYGKLYSKNIDKSGKHRNTGILITNFEVREGEKSLHDVAPTVLDLLSVERDEDMDGDSLLER